MGQTVRNAQIFSESSAMGQPVINRAPRRDALQDTLNFIRTMGAASDLIDKLGNNELAKTAADRLAEVRRQQMIREKGVPTADLDIDERQQIINQAIQTQGLQPQPNVQLQAPQPQTPPSSPGLGVGPLQLGPPSGLPGELYIPAPGEQQRMMQAQMAAQALPAPQMAPELQLDPATQQPVAPPLHVPDEHLRPPVELKNLPQVMEIAKTYGSNPAIMAQLEDSIDRLEGLSPQGLFGLMRGAHMDDARRRLYESAAKGRQDQLKMQKDLASIEATLSRMGLDPLKKANLMADFQRKMNKNALFPEDIQMMKDKLENIEARTAKIKKETEWIGKRRPGSGIHIYMNQKQDKTADALTAEMRRRAEADLAKAKADQEKTEVEKVASLNTMIKKSIDVATQHATGQDRIKKLSSHVKSLENISREIAGEQADYMNETLAESGFGHLAGKDANQIRANIRKALDAAQSDLKSTRRELRTNIASTIKSWDNASDKVQKMAFLEDKIRQRVKDAKVSAAKANSLFTLMLKYRESGDTKTLNELITQLVEEFNFRAEDLME